MMSIRISPRTYQTYEKFENLVQRTLHVAVCEGYHRFCSNSRSPSISLGCHADGTSQLGSNGKYQYAFSPYHASNYIEIELRRNLTERLQPEPYRVSAATETTV